MEIIENFIGFDWDKGNKDKNRKKHRVTNTECEEIFFNVPIIVEPDSKHSLKEDRFYILGQTNKERLLFLVFTLRKDKIRVISARDMTRKERVIYNEFKEKNTEI